MPPEYTGDDLHAALTAAIAACVSTPGSAPADPAARAETPGSASAHGARHTLEMRQLGRRGVCRFLGSVVVAQYFGVTRKARDGDAHTFVAGLQNNEYVWVSDTGICSKFLEAVRQADFASAPARRPPCFDAGGTPSVTDLVEYTGAWREFLKHVGKAAPTLKMGGGGRARPTTSSIASSASTCWRARMGRIGATQFRQCFDACPWTNASSWPLCRSTGRRAMCRA